MPVRQNQLILFLFRASQPGKNRRKEESETQEKNTKSRLIVYECLIYFLLLSLSFFGAEGKAPVHRREICRQALINMLSVVDGNSFSHERISIWGSRVCATVLYQACQQSQTDFHCFALSPFLPQHNTSFWRGVYPQTSNPSIQKLSALYWNSNTRQHIGGFLYSLTF